MIIKKKKIQTKKLINVSGLQKIKIEPNKYGYSRETILILNHWRRCGGRVHVNGATKGPNKIDNIIFELLLDGRNEYSPIVPIPFYKNKQWTIPEIKECIDQYSAEREINDMYFNEFVRCLRNKSKQRGKEYSRLVESHQELNNSQSTKFLKSFKNAMISNFDITPYPKVVRDIAIFLEKIYDEYELTQRCMVHNYQIVPIYISYIKQETNIADQMKVLNTYPLPPILNISLNNTQNKDF